MAIKVSGAVVIDDDKSLKNISSIKYPDGTIQSTAPGAWIKTNYYPGTLLYTITNPNAYSTYNEDNFGYSIAASNGYCIVGAYNEDSEIGVQSGVAYIFNTSSGQLLHTLYNPSQYNAGTYDYFGRSVAICGNYAAVAAENEDGAYTQQGRVYVYNVITGELIYTINHPNESVSSSSYTYFGYRLSMSNEYIAVNSWQNDGDFSTGRVWIFNITDGSLLTSIYDPNAYGTLFYDYFGTSMALSEKYGVFGTPYEDSSLGEDGSGVAYVYDMQSATPFPKKIWTLSNPNTFSTSTDDYFAYSVATNNKYCIIGAYQEDQVGPTPDSGKAYIYDLDTGMLIRTLSNPNAFDIPESDRFGYSVAISNKYAAVSAYSEDDSYSSGTDSGKVYIFDIVTGELIFTLNNPNAYSTSNFDYFGWSVAMTDDCVIVGAPNEDNPTDSGIIYIYSLRNVATTKNINSINFANGLDITKSLKKLTKISKQAGTLIHVLNNPNLYSRASDDQFGESLAISGNYAAVGTSREDNSPSGLNSGAVYIFNVTTGELLHKIRNPNAFSTFANDYFGQNIAMSGNYLVVGAPYEDESGSPDSGKAYIFNVNTGTLVWTLNNQNAFSTSGYDYFGATVAISGNYVAVSAYNEDESSNSNSGKVYIFNLTTGLLTSTLSNPNAYSTSAGDVFGISIAMSNDRIVVSAPSEDDSSGLTSGKAYVFSVITGKLLYTLNNPNAYDTSSGDSFGGSWLSTAISNKYVAVSAYNEDSSDGTMSGAVYVFDVMTGNLIYTFVNPDIYTNASGDAFGNSISLSGQYLIAGSDESLNYTDFTGNTTGVVYIFDLIEGKLIHVLNNPNFYGTPEGDYFGRSLCASEEYILISAYFEDVTNTGGGFNNLSSGRAYIYSAKDLTYLDRLYTLVS